MERRVVHLKLNLCQRDEQEGSVSEPRQADNQKACSKQSQPGSRQKKINKKNPTVPG